jgi:hypothetical protein
MILRTLKTTILLCAVTATSSVFAQLGNGLGTGKFGTFNTYSAYSLEPGFLSTYNNGRVFVAAGQSGNLANVTNVNLWHASNNMTVAYGIVEHFDALLSIVTYQDLNLRIVRSEQSLVPGDIYLTLRTGSHDMLDGRLGLGAALTGKMPTGGQQNIPFEIYRSKNPEAGLLAMGSFYGNPYYKDQSFIFNVNVGLWSHMDNGSLISPTKSGVSTPIKSTKNTMHMQYGLGILYPVASVELLLDAHGVSYIGASKHIYSRESNFYVTPGLRYNLRSWLNIGTYADILVAGKADKTTYLQSTGVLKPGETNTSKGAPNYATWRLGFSLGFNILPLNLSSAPTEQRRKRLLDRLVEEEKGAQKASSQLEKLKSVRVNAEKELEKIRLELEGGGQ